MQMPTELKKEEIVREGGGSKMLSFIQDVIQFDFRWLAAKHLVNALSDRCNAIVFVKYLNCSEC